MNDKQINELLVSIENCIDHPLLPLDDLRLVLALLERFPRLEDEIALHHAYKTIKRHVEYMEEKRNELDQKNFKEIYES